MRTNFNEIVSSDNDYFDNINSLIEAASENEEELIRLREEIRSIKEERKANTSFSDVAKSVVADISSDFTPTDVTVDSLVIPVLTLKANTTIASGDGTESNPYVIG